MKSTFRTAKKIDDDIVRSLIPERPKASHKGTYGRLLVIAGSNRMPGALRLINRSSYRVGVGLVEDLCPKSISNIIKADIPEAIVSEIAENQSGEIAFAEMDYIKERLAGKNALAFGSGIGLSQDVAKILEDLIKGDFQAPILIDGDGLNLLSRNLDILRDHDKEVILTPHPLEFSRLSGRPVDYILENKEELARDFALKYRVNLVLKDHISVISNSKGDLYYSDRGDSSLSKAGTGDVLAGMISGYLAQGVGSLESMVLSVYIHGLAGEIAGDRYGTQSVMATEVIGSISEAIKMIKG